MFIAPNTVLEDLRAVIASLGDDGGSVSPSVYDTAQLLRFAPPRCGVEPALTWLIGQQHPDGGWGEPSVPAARDVSTLAAILAIHTYDPSAPAREAVRAGVEFLRQQASQWADLHVDAMPIAAEMILPVLLREARESGLDIDCTAYARVFEFHRQKLRLLSHVKLAANTAPTYSWEALGQPFDAAVLDPWTGVGHSPAATAAWLAAGRAAQTAPARLSKAEAYLARAEASTRTGIPGVVPVVYPITGFEVSYGLYALLLTGILDLPALQDVVQPKLAQLADMIVPDQGLSFGDNFVPDVDVTSVAVASLRAMGHVANDHLVRRFFHSGHFYTYAHELNPSVFSNAHALHALRRCDSRCPETEAFLLERQLPGGQWIPDKWHASWRGTTMEAVLALDQLGYQDSLRRGAKAIVDDQRPDGSWWTNGSPSWLETAYSVMALRALDNNGLLCTQGAQALAGADRWLATMRPSFAVYETRWLGKEVYAPERVDQAYLLSAIASAEFANTSNLGYGSQRQFVYA